MAALRARVQLLEEDLDLCYEEIDILNEQLRERAVTPNKKLPSMGTPERSMSSLTRDPVIGI